MLSILEALNKFPNSLGTLGGNIIRANSDSSSDRKIDNHRQIAKNTIVKKDEGRKLGFKQFRVSPTIVQNPVE